MIARSEAPMKALKVEFGDRVEFLNADLADFEVGSFLLFMLKSDGIGRQGRGGDKEATFC